MSYRINYFDQIKGYYSFIFNSEKDVRPVHTSLYMFLLNQNNRINWVEWFKCPYDLGMQGAQISSKTTYYKALDDLVSFGLIEYEKGLNLHKSPKIKIIKLKSSVAENDTLSGNVTVPLSEPLSVPLLEPLTGKLSGNIYRLLTDNYKLVNKFLPDWILKHKEDIDPIVNWDGLKDQFNEITKKKTTVINGKTKKAILARLKEGYSKQSIVDAIQNCFDDSYHKETGHKYLTLEFISRPDKMEKYSTMTKQKPKPIKEDKL